MSASNLHIAWAELLLASLASAGVRNVVVSPGSRSTPLVLAAAKESRVTCRVIVDERSAAFFALGQARASSLPTALICTSGTAAAHYFPAVIEASQSFLSLLVVCADRPWEDRDTGASQTVDQVKMFGDYVRHFAELGPPDPSPSSFRAVARIAAQCVHRAMSPTPGPVQLNVQFRKPLEPVSAIEPEAWKSSLDEVVRKGAPKIFSSPTSVDAHALNLVLEAVAHDRGLIVCGPASDASLREPLCELASQLGYPIVAESTSQLRFGGARPSVVQAAAFDTYFRSSEFRQAHRAAVVLEIGAAPTSGGYAGYLTECRDLKRFVIAAHGHSDPRGDATALIHAEPGDFVRALSEKWSAARRDRASDWSNIFARAEVAAWSRAAEDTRASDLNEAVIANAVVDALPEGGTLIVGNSNPVRDLDTFVPPTARAIAVVHQRGAAGIDGMVSGAAGFASLAPAPTILYVGDLTLLHDLAGFAAVRHVEAPLVVVVVQNRGGRIFEELPLFGSTTPEETFETYFATEQSIDFEKAAAAFGIRFHLAESSADLRQALQNGLAQNGCTIIEARVPPHDGSRRRKKFRADVARLLANEKRA
jgi:2-succinyl-5-enolpyruvyl-6-hydroxy-3-cyclohexene-1-carboxylate synthase